MVFGMVALLKELLPLGHALGEHAFPIFTVLFGLGAHHADQRVIRRHFEFVEERIEGVAIGAQGHRPALNGIVVYLKDFF